MNERDISEIPISKQKLVAKVCSFQQTLLMLSIDWCDDELVVEVEPHE